MADKSDNELARETDSTLDAARRVLDKKLPGRTAAVVQDVAERVIASHRARVRRKGVPDRVRCEHALAVMESLRTLTAITQQLRTSPNRAEYLRLQKEFEALSKEIGFTRSIDQSDLRQFYEAACRGERMDSPVSWDPAIAIRTEYYELLRDSRTLAHDTHLHPDDAIERLLFARAGLSSDQRDGLVQLRMEELEDASLASCRDEPSVLGELSLRDVLLRYSQTVDDIYAVTASQLSDAQLGEQIGRNRQQVDRLLIEMARTPLRVLKSIVDVTPLLLDFGRHVHRIPIVVLPAESEQIAILRDLHHLLLANGKRARDAATRLSLEWRKHVAEYIEQVTGGDPYVRGPGDDYCGNHHGLVLALRHRLLPYQELYEHGRADALRKLRGIDSALECAVLVLLAEDPDFDAVGWGLEPLGAWSSAIEERTASQWAALGWPGLASNRALIRMFAVSTMYVHVHSWEPRFAVLWAMAQHVRETLKAAVPTTTTDAQLVGKAFDVEGSAASASSDLQTSMRLCSLAPRAREALRTLERQPGASALATFIADSINVSERTLRNDLKAARGYKPEPLVWSKPGVGLELTDTGRAHVREWKRIGKLKS